MKLKRKLASMALAGGLAATGLVATAPSAAADEPCPSGKLCLYKSSLYRERTFTSTSTAVCYDLAPFGMGHDTNGVNSYRNFLPVKATIYTEDTTRQWYDPDTWWARYTINPGSFSSNTYGAGSWTKLWVCTGTAKPWEKLWL